jgi:hypothetical protein
VFLTLPALAGLPIGSSLFVSRSRAKLGASSGTPFVTDRNDLTAEQRFRTGDWLRVSYSYNFQRNHTFDPEADPDVGLDLPR